MKLDRAYGLSKRIIEYCTRLGDEDGFSGLNTVIPSLS